jgi:hypothetical protein
MEQVLSRAARKAINDLELPCEVVDVASLSDSEGWRIEFTTGYGLLSDSFQDENGRRYSDDKIIEIRQDSTAYYCFARASICSIVSASTRRACSSSDTSSICVATHQRFPDGSCTPP